MHLLEQRLSFSRYDLLSLGSCLNAVHATPLMREGSMCCTGHLNESKTRSIAGCLRFLTLIRCFCGILSRDRLLPAQVRQFPAHGKAEAASGGGCCQPGHPKALG